MSAHAINEENMKEKNVKILLISGIVISIAALLQLYATLRYIKRMPGDTFGVILYSIVFLLFVILAIVNFTRWRKVKK